METLYSGGPVLKLVLDEEPEDYFDNVDGMIASFSENPEISVVHVNGCFLCGLDDEMVEPVYRAIGKLPALQELHMRGVVNVKSLGCLMAEARGLKVLDLDNAQLDGNRDDFIDLEFSLKFHPALLDVSLQNVDVSVCSIKVWSEIDGLVKAIVSIPNMQSLKVGATEFDRLSFTGSVLAPISRSTTLRVLHLRNISIGKLHAGAISWTIKQSKTLRELVLSSCEIDDNVMDRIGLALGSLETLDLSGNQVGDKGVASIAQGLLTNTTLRKIDLSGNENITNHGQAMIANMLHTNKTLQYVELPSDTEASVDIHKQLTKNRKTDAAIAA